MPAQVFYGSLKEIDFNSALYFSAFMSYRTIYATSVVLNCSPATVSIMIKRFCSYFTEPLLERKGRILKPTRYALELDKIISQMLAGFHFLLASNINNNKYPIY